MLGIFTDETLTVTAVRSHLPAEAAGVKVGDKLLDVRPAADEPGVSPEPVPFMDEDAVNELIQHQIATLIPPCCGGPSLPLILRVERGGETLELHVTYDFPNEPFVEPTPEVSPIGTPTPYPTPLPTVTPVPLGWKYF